MIDFNFQAIGYLTADATAHQVEDKYAVSFTLAVNRKFKESEKSTFLPITVWMKSTGLLPFLTKGKRIAVLGEWYEQRRVSSADGVDRYFSSFTGREIKLLSNDAQNQAAPANQTPPQTPSAAPKNDLNQSTDPNTLLEEEDDDLPF